MPIGVSNPSVGISLVGSGISGGLGPWTPGGWSPVTLTNKSGGALAFGSVCFLSAADQVQLALAHGGGIAAASAVCISIDASIANNASGRFVFGGLVPGAGAGQTFNTLAYLAAGGGFSAAPDLTVGDFNTILGLWIDATTLSFNPQLPIQN